MRSLRTPTATAVLAMTVATLIGVNAVAAGASRPAREHRRGGRVLRVGEWRGRRGGFDTIQDAVDAARPGDWILIAPGDYHERADYTGHQVSADKAGAGVLIRTPGIHLRGLDRNRVVVDGTKPGSKPCDPAPAAQDFGPADGSGRGAGRNGIEVFEVYGVTVENLTVCNFLDGAKGGGNQIWFNGGDGSGQTHIGAFRGAYLSATSTYFDTSKSPRAEYGIFVSNSHGPGVLAHTYASNMADSSYYVGACPDCNTLVTDAHAQNSALGYSGTNAGGHLVIERSEWDHNKTGISTNSQNNDDAPSPQSGACPGSPGRSCTFFRNNWIHDNNNPNVPQSGSAGLGPVGTGIVVAGGRFDTITQNRFDRNGAWGVLLVPFPDSGTPPPVAHCEGGQQQPGLCYYDDWGNEVTGNRFSGNGFFGNPTNGDGGDISGLHDPGNCWHGNLDPTGFTGAPGDLQATHGVCGVANQGADLGNELTAQVICDTEVFGPCPDAPGKHYPRATSVVLRPMTRQRSMPEVCEGVPDDAWC